MGHELISSRRRRRRVGRIRRRRAHRRQRRGRTAIARRRRWRSSAHRGPRDDGKRRRKGWIREARSLQQLALERARGAWRGGDSRHHDRQGRACECVRSSQGVIRWRPASHRTPSVSSSVAVAERRPKLGEIDAARSGRTPGTNDRHRLAGPTLAARCRVAVSSPLLLPPVVVGRVPRGRTFARFTRSTPAAPAPGHLKRESS